MITTFSHANNKNGFIYMENNLFQTSMWNESLLLYIVWLSALFDHKQEEKSIKYCTLRSG